MSQVKHYLPDDVYTADQVRKLEQIAIEQLGISGHRLMQRAANFSYQMLKKHWPLAKKIIVICGCGHNAGDGYTLARMAFKDAKEVTVTHLLHPDKLTGSARLAYQEMLASGIQPVLPAKAELANHDVIVDAIFGIGLNREITGEIKRLIASVNILSLPVLSIDIPSGLHADTGKTMPVALKASITTCFIGLKRGMFSADGLHHSGQIIFSSLDIPAEIYQQSIRPAASRLRYTDLASVLPRRPLNSHKGLFGHVLVVGGDYGYLGAARLAAEGAARVGAGLVSIATRPDHAALLSMSRPELMAHGVTSIHQLLFLMQRASIIVIGPGLGQSEWAKSLLMCVLNSTLPLIIDADALSLLANHQRTLVNSVITPHPGEAARLLETDTQSVQRNRFAALTALHDKYQGLVVLKGSGTLITDGDGHQFICDSGNPGMSSAGMGDVLSGVIAGLIAQGIDMCHAVKLGVCLHAVAADKAVQLDGERGLMAMDLMPYLRRLVNP